MAGTTLDMVQIHERDNFQYCMSYMTKARSYCSLDFYSIFNKDNIDDLEVSSKIIRVLTNIFFKALIYDDGIFIILIINNNNIV